MPELSLFHVFSQNLHEQQATFFIRSMRSSMNYCQYLEGEFTAYCHFHQCIELRIMSFQLKHCIWLSVPSNIYFTLVVHCIILAYRHGNNMNKETDFTTYIRLI